jgi:hypothetical protein
MSSSYVYRKIWKDFYGDIPKDKNGRSMEIHHINGNHNDNHIENLKLVTIEEHYDTHYSQGDWGACVMIAKRMEKTSEELSLIQQGKKRPGVGGVKKGTVPWNKNKKGYTIHNSEHIEKLKHQMIGEGNPNTKLSENDVKRIRLDYENNVTISSFDSNIRPTYLTKGLFTTYLGAFSNEYAKKYNVSSNNIKRIIQNKSWKNIK